MSLCPSRVATVQKPADARRMTLLQLVKGSIGLNISDSVGIVAAMVSRRKLGLVSEIDGGAEEGNEALWEGKNRDC